MPTKSLLLQAVATVLLAISGCTINDPSHNDKIRFTMAQIHAERVFEDAGAQFSRRDYDLMIFWRKHYDKEERVLHAYQLYDFARKNDAPTGPERFVIAYDKVTRSTYLRSDLMA